MRKVIFGGALVGALTLALTTTALAQTTMETSLGIAPAKAGTSKKPKPVSLRLGIEGGTQSGTGQPDTSTSIRVQLPKGIKWNGKAWPRSKRCSVSRANAEGSFSVCPKGSRIGSGHVTALGGNGSVVEEIDLDAFVTTGGNLGTFLTATQPLPINAMLEGRVSGQLINIAIPTNIQEPVTGVPTGIRTLNFTLNGKVKVKGKTRGVVESSACSGGKWTGTITNVLRTGTLTDKPSATCRK
jgi:cytoskeletal protein CcmA (bactofilin family)